MDTKSNFCYLYNRPAREKRCGCEDLRSSGKGLLLKPTDRPSIDDSLATDIPELSASANGGGASAPAEQPALMLDRIFNFNTHEGEHP